MKKLLLLICMFGLFILPRNTFALGLEAAVGYWSQDPAGDLQYKGTALDLVDTLDYEKEYRPFARVKADLPLFLPNVYVMATPMEFEGSAVKSVDIVFGGQTFSAGAEFYSKTRADHYDIAFYYSIPFLNMATLGKLSAEVGINARIIDFEAEVRQDALSLSESKSATIPVPMIYAGIQLKPISLVHVELEGRGIAYNANHYYDFIGRVKVRPIPLFFIAGGYRYEDIKFDVSSIEASLQFQGPFAEVGIDF